MVQRPRQCVVLAQLARATATQIGAQANMHKTKVSRAVFALEARKWLARSTDETDRRVEWLHLTRSGRAQFAKLSQSARLFESELVAELGDKATRQLLSALTRIEEVRLPDQSRPHSRAR